MPPCRADPCLFPKVNTTSHSPVWHHIWLDYKVLCWIFDSLEDLEEAHGWFEVLTQVVISLLFIFLVSFITSALKACALGLVCQRHHQALQRQWWALIPHLHCHFLCSYKPASSQVFDINHILTGCWGCFDCGECGYTIWAQLGAPVQGELTWPT